MSTGAALEALNQVHQPGRETFNTRFCEFCLKSGKNPVWRARRRWRAGSDAGLIGLILF